MRKGLQLPGQTGGLKNVRITDRWPGNEAAACDAGREDKEEREPEGARAKNILTSKRDVFARTVGIQGHSFSLRANSRNEQSPFEQPWWKAWQASVLLFSLIAATPR